MEAADAYVGNMIINISSSGVEAPGKRGIKNRIRSLLPAFFWTWLRVSRIRYTLARYDRRRVRHNYGGYELEIELIDPMGADWYDHDCPAYPEIAFLRDYRLRSGAKVFDIGAHQCVVASVLSRIVGSSGFVLAVEASRDNCSAGERNMSLNGIRNCEVLHAAGAAESGTIFFNRGMDGQVDDGTGEWGRTKVKAVSIDDLSLTYGVPDVLFIDVEGFECAVLKGAQSTLGSRPDCFVEVHIGAGLEKFGGSVSELLGLFPSGYQFFMASRDGSFVRFDESSPLLAESFFLIAVN
jgi:FkbM family methyltransferase